MKKNGFTLIEIMVLLAIFGIALSILFSAIDQGRYPFGNYRESRVVPDNPAQTSTDKHDPDFNTCTYLGVDTSNRAVFKCPDSKIYTGSVVHANP